MIQQVRLAVTLLRAHVPVLVVGERLGQQVRANSFSNANVLLSHQKLLRSFCNSGNFFRCLLECHVLKFCLWV